MKKKKFKYLTPETLEMYATMNRDQLVSELVLQSKHLITAKNSNASSSYVKDLSKEISDYREKNTDEDLEKALEEVKKLKDARDAKIAADIAELNDLRKSMKEAVKALDERINFLLELLAQNDLFR